MAGVNKVILVGNLGKDPEVKYLDSGVAVANFSLATTENYKNKEGDRVSQTEWHNVVLWRGLAEVAEKYLKKGSKNVIGDSFRGATWVSIHNGGGVGWGEVINGGFGMLIDGTKDAERRLKSMLFWDVNNGVSRRSWARNNEANFAIIEAMNINPKLQVTMPHQVDDNIIDSLRLE